MRTLALWVLGSTAVLSGCSLDAAPGDADLGRAARSIIGGSPDTNNYPSVGGIAVTRPPDDEGMARDPLFCTGTLVGTRVVLTTALCVQANAEAGDLAGIDARFGNASFSSADPVAVEEIQLERYYTGGENGLALLLLAEAPGGNAAPVEIGGEPAVDDEVTLVGYGSELEGGDDDAVKRRQFTDGTVPVRSVFGDYFIAGADDLTTCAGDSGGPVFDGQDRVIGVTSFQGDCDKNVYRVRTDVQAADFIHAYVDRFDGACAQDDVCTTVGCRTPDPDCDPCGWDGACTEDCPVRDLDCPLGSFLGEACELDGNCEEHGACIPAADDADFTYCTRACDAEDPAACPDTMACTDGRCEFLTPSPGSQGSECTAAVQCRSGICEDRICVFECDPGVADSCAAPYVCGPSDESPGTNVCLGTDLSGGGGFCSASGDGAGAAAWLLLGVAIVFARRRRA